MLYDDKNVVVTGAGQGIGEACARELARQGARVAVLDLNEDAAGVVADEVGGISRRVDVADRGSVEDAAAYVAREFGGIDLSVACAGITVRPRTAEDFSEDLWKRIFDVDLWGVFNTAVVFQRLMSARGSHVFIASVAGMRSLPLHAYGPAKAGVISLAQTLAAEYGPDGIRVNAISPGFILSPAMQGMIDRGEKDAATIIDDTALGRFLAPSEIATAVAFLGSDAASGVSGINLAVDGGWMAASSWHSYGGKETTRRLGRQGTDRQP